VPQLCSWFGELALANVAGGIKQLAEDYGIAEGTPAHAALHAVSSCIGAGAAGANCGTAAAAAAGATLISSLLSAQDNDALSNEQKRRARHWFRH
jgi:filamentous hemagglutinin